MQLLIYGGHHGVGVIPEKCQVCGEEGSALASRGGVSASSWRASCACGRRHLEKKVPGGRDEALLAAIERP